MTVVRAGLPEINPLVMHAPYVQAMCWGNARSHGQEGSPCGLSTLKRSLVITAMEVIRASASSFTEVEMDTHTLNEPVSTSERRGDTRDSQFRKQSHVHITGHPTPLLRASHHSLLLVVFSEPVKEPGSLGFLLPPGGPHVLEL